MRPKPLSGFPEFLPAGRIVEQAVLDSLRETFELHGFASIETRAVETTASLTRKGEITKEVYVVRRIHAEPVRRGVLQAIDAELAQLNAGEDAAVMEQYAAVFAEEEES